MTTTDARPTGQERESTGRMPSFGLRHLMFAVVVVALLLAALVRFGRVLLAVALIVAPVILVVGVVVVLIKRREAEREALLRFLAIAAERRMPLAPGIEACAELCGGGYRRRALGLARLVESGVPLPVALDAIPGLLPGPATVLACVGWAEGALAPALRAAEDAVAARKAYRSALVPRLAYLIGVLLAMQMILGFVFYFIIPRFKAIFTDFGIGLPQATVVAIQAGHILLGTGLLPLLVLVELVVLAYVPLASFGYVTWEPPLIPWLLRRRDTATILRALAVGVEAGRPLEAVLSSLARVYPRRGMSRRLARASGRVRVGEPWLAALAAEGLAPAADLGVLEAAGRAGNLSWALRTLADAHDRRQGYRLAALTQVVFPAAVVMLGLLVGLFVVSLFLPLIQLIDRMAG